jgi:membrane protease YdiL (CAAX protease family)
MQAGPLSGTSIFTLNGRVHPVWRVVLYIVSFFVSVISVQGVVTAGWLVYRLSSGAATMDLAALIREASSPSPTLLLSLSIVQLVDVLVLTFLFRRYIDRQPFRSLGFDTSSGWASDTLAGFLLGLAAMALVFVVEQGTGWAVVRPGGATWTGLALILLVYLVTYAAVAVTEELIFRGYILQTLMEWPGVWGAALISALIFSVFHGMNPGISRLALVHLAVAGLVFAGAYLATHRLWLGIGLHFGWNFFQGPVFGFPVSGLASRGVFSVHDGGPALLTGAAFGPEGGLLGLGALLFCALVIWAWTRRHSPGVWPKPWTGTEKP